MHGDGLAAPRGHSRYGLRVSEQEARSTAAGEGHSVHPVVAGVPWWGAILIATAATLTGIAIDATGPRELTNVFAALYLLGCMAAVLAVRQQAVFTAVVQPPLILFVAVPAANYMFHRAEIAGVKDLLINCGYPLIERFPLMLITSLLVLLVGVARWYLAHAERQADPAHNSAYPDSGIAQRISALLGRSTSSDDARPSRKPAPGRKAEGPRSAGERRPQRRAAPRSRHVRPSTDDPSSPAPAQRRRYTDYDRGDDLPGPPPSRRRRPQGDTGSRTTPRRREREPTDRDERPRRRDREPMDPGGRPRRVTSYDDRHGPYEPEPFDPPPSTRHPFSNVRYRGSESDDDDRKYRRRRDPLDP